MEKLKKWLEDFEEVKHLLPKRVEKVLAQCGAIDRNFDGDVLPNAHRMFVESDWKPLSDPEILEFASQSGIDTTSEQDLLAWFKSNLRILLEHLIKSKGKPASYEFIRRLRWKDSDYVAKRVLEEFGLKKRTRARKWPQYILDLERELEEAKISEAPTKAQIHEKNVLFYAKDKKDNPTMPHSERMELMQDIIRMEAEMKKKKHTMRSLREKIAFEKSKFRLATDSYGKNREEN